MDRKAKVIQLERKANRPTDLHPWWLNGQDPDCMTQEDRLAALARRNAAQGNPPDYVDPDLKAQLDSMTLAERIDMVKEIRRRRLALEKELGLKR